MHCSAWYTSYTYIDSSKILIAVILQVEPGLIDDVYEDDISKDDTKYFLDGCNRFNIKKVELMN